MKNISAQIWLSRGTRCAGRGCKQTIRHPMDGIFICRGGKAVGFCCKACFLTTINTMVEGEKLDKDVNSTDQLLKMGYTKK